jgi:hypothetical protein
MILQRVTGIEPALSASESSDKAGTAVIAGCLMVGVSSELTQSDNPGPSSYGTRCGPRSELPHHAVAPNLPPLKSCAMAAPPLNARSLAGSSTPSADSDVDDVWLAVVGRHFVDDQFGELGPQQVLVFRDGA